MKPVENTREKENRHTDSTSDKIYSDIPKPTFDGDNLRKLRKEAGFSLRSLAQKIRKQYNYPITFQSLALIEAGEMQPRGYLLVAFAKIFGKEEISFYKEQT